MIPGAVALVATLACAALRGWPQIPRGLTLVEAALLALATGVALRPPLLRGVALTLRRERLWLAIARFFGEIVLILLTALLLLAAFDTPHPWVWTIPAAIWAGAAALSISVLPLLLEIPWYKLAAGALLAGAVMWAS